MNVWVSQGYMKPGINFPFSCDMQGRLSDELSSLVEASAQFQARYPGFKLGVEIDADTGIHDNVIKGPGIFKKWKNVEYRLILPYDVIVRSPDGFRSALTYLLTGIRSILQSQGLDVTRLDEMATAIIESIASDATMLEEPWPSGGARNPRDAGSTEWPGRHLFEADEEIKYPMDADGLTLHHLAKKFDLSKPMDIEFTIVDLPSERSGKEVVKLAAQRGYTPVLEFEEDHDEWILTCTKRIVPTYEAIVEAQKELSELSAPFGGSCNEWAASVHQATRRVH